MRACHGGGGVNALGPLARPVFSLQNAQGTRILGEEEGGRAVLALLDDGGGKLGRLAVPHLNVYATPLLELLEDGADELFAAPGVDHQRVFAWRQRLLGCGLFRSGLLHRALARGCPVGLYAFLGGLVGGWLAAGGYQ